VIQILVQFNPNINIHNKGVLYSAPFLIKKINQMKLIKPYFEIEPFNASLMMRNIEKAGRTCYKSEDKITNDSADKFVEMLLSKGHESVIEHEKITVRIICDRGVSHELVRHRIASFSQESTRYCNYSKDKYDNEIIFIIPPWLNLKQGKYTCSELISTDRDVWLRNMKDSELDYMYLTQVHGWSAQKARSVLPNALKTEIVITANLREWREIFRQRTAPAAHPQMREIMIPLLETLQKRLPIIFNI